MSVSIIILCVFVEFYEYISWYLTPKGEFCLDTL